MVKKMVEKEQVFGRGECQRRRGLFGDRDGGSIRFLADEAKKEKEFLVKEMVGGEDFLVEEMTRGEDDFLANEMAGEDN